MPGFRWLHQEHQIAGCLGKAPLANKVPKTVPGAKIDPCEHYTAELVDCTGRCKAVKAAVLLSRTGKMKQGVQGLQHGLRIAHLQELNSDSATPV